MKPFITLKRRAATKLFAMTTTLALCLTFSATASAWWWNTGYTDTKYPIVLAHGMLGFDNIGPIDYWYGIPEALESDGADVYVAQLSSFGSAELRGEQLLAQVEDILAITGAQKVNLIGHSQGGHTVRYVAGVASNLVASVTTVGGPAKGTPVADLIAVLPELPVVGDFLATSIGGAVNLVGWLIGVSAGETLPQESLGSLALLSSAGSQQFNESFPGGVPTSTCGEGAYNANGVNYYSWSGTGASYGPTNVFDISSYGLLLPAALLFNEANDGMVGRCSSHIGKVIRDNYYMDHLDEVNQIFGLTDAWTTNPKTVYRQQANRLKNAGL